MALLDTLRAAGRRALASAQAAARAALGAPAAPPAASRSRRDPAAGPQVVPVLDEWDVEDVRRALYAHEHGDFRQSALLADQMGRDARIAGVLGTRVNAVLSMPRGLRLPPDVAPERRAEAERALALLKPRFSRLVTRGARATALRWLVVMGVAVCQRVWERDPRTGLWDVKLQPWHPTWVQWDAARGVYVVQTLEGQEDCPPDGSNPRWVAIPLLDDDRPWMVGAVRALAIPWLILSWAYRDWARWSEKHGLPPLAAKVPLEERFAAATDAFLDDLQQLASEPTILLAQRPDGASHDLEWKELKNWQSYQGFKELAAEAATNVAIVLLGQNLTTEVKGGSFAAARIHELVRRDYLLGTATALDDGERRGVAVPFTQANLLADPFDAEELAPCPTTDTDVAQEPEAAARTSEGRARAAKAWAEAGVQVDATAMARADGVAISAEAKPQNTAPIFAYHITTGVVTIDEARATLGLPPLPGGAGAKPAAVADGQGVEKLVRALPARYEGIDLRPTTGMAAAARRGLELHDEGLSGDGLKPETVRRAHQIAAREDLTPGHWREMAGWFARHASDRTPGWSSPPTPGYVAWMLWGGDPGEERSRAVAERLDRADAEDA